MPWLLVSVLFAYSRVPNKRHPLPAPRSPALTKFSTLWEYLVSHLQEKILNKYESYF